MMVVGGGAAAVEHGRGREIRGKDSDDRGAEALTHSLAPSFWLWPHCSQCAQKVRKRRPAQTAAAAGRKEGSLTGGAKGS